MVTASAIAATVSMSGIKKQSSQLAVIGLAAALMGIGQNGLLVSLPFLVEQSAFDLPTWSILIAIGSFLFLPSAPFWGRVSDRHGPKRVVIQALAGMAVSFSLLALFAIVSRDSSLWYVWCLSGLVIARVIYGCTVSGMVPASQHWAIMLCGEQNRLQAITSVSIGLSVGRLVGPVISIFALKISPFAPLMIMVLLPVIALCGALLLPAPQLVNQSDKVKPSLPWLPRRRLWRYLTSGLLLCAAIALLQYSFSPLIGALTDWPTGQISDAIGVLLTISAACTFVTQVMVIKKKTHYARANVSLGFVTVIAGVSDVLNKSDMDAYAGDAARSCWCSAVGSRLYFGGDGAICGFTGRGGGIHFDVAHYWVRFGVATRIYRDALAKLSNLSVCVVCIDHCADGICTNAAKCA